MRGATLVVLLLSGCAAPHPLLGDLGEGEAYFAGFTLASKEALVGFTMPHGGTGWIEAVPLADGPVEAWMMYTVGETLSAYVSVPSTETQGRGLAKTTVQHETSMAPFTWSVPPGDLGLVLAVKARPGTNFGLLWRDIPEARPPATDSASLLAGIDGAARLAPLGHGDGWEAAYFLQATRDDGAVYGLAAGTLRVEQEGVAPAVTTQAWHEREGTGHAIFFGRHDVGEGVAAGHAQGNAFGEAVDARTSAVTVRDVAAGRGALYAGSGDATGTLDIRFSLETLAMPQHLFIVDLWLDTPLITLLGLTTPFELAARDLVVLA